MAKIFAQGTLDVTGADEVVIDEILPQNKALLQNPEQYVSVQFDPNQPAPPPCAGGVQDEVDWELVFKHTHQVGFFSRKPKEQLKLKIMWQVQTSRTVIWSISQP